MLQPVSPVERIHALFLTGGGMFALPAHGGVLRYLEERKVGFDWGTPDLRIPIVVVGGHRRSRGRQSAHPARCRRRLQGLRGRVDVGRSPKATSAPAPAPPSARCTAAAASAA